MATYTFVNGSKTQIPALNEKKKENYIKVNLPDSLKSYNTGNGEGVWAVVDDTTFLQHKKNKNGSSFAKILNNSVYYPGLNFGTVVPIELKGKNRPVVPYYELTAIYDRIPESAKTEARDAILKELGFM